jgi:hypothetical protein
MSEEPFCAARFLTLMEGEDEEAFEAALQTLNDRHILPELSNLPVPACDGEAAIRLRREQQLVQQNKLSTELSENDPLRLYLEELATVPACGDVQLLSERLLSGDRTAAGVVPLVRDCFRFIAEFSGEVPGASAKDCGNYLDMNLPMANYWGRHYAALLENIPADRLVYPE